MACSMSADLLEVSPSLGSAIKAAFEDAGVFPSHPRKQIALRVTKRTLFAIKLGAWSGSVARWEGAPVTTAHRKIGRVGPLRWKRFELKSF